MIRFTAVLVHRNAPELLEGTLRAFDAQHALAGIVVVDNGSSADHLNRLRQGLERRRLAHPGGVGVEVLEAGENLGFGPGANLGLRHWLNRCETPWVALAPHDAHPAADCFARVGAELARRPRAGLACADVGDGGLPVLDPYFGGMVVPGAEDAEGWEDVDYPHGTLMFAGRRALADIGLFDERYFAYCEEADLGARATAAGWRVGLVRGARVTNTHLGSQVALVDYLQHRNTLLLVRTHSGRYHTFIRCCISLYQLSAGLLRPARRGLVFDARARADGVIDFLRGRFGPPPSRYLSR
ncbi:MAG: glycosyltransferase family 2 protein [Microthrixaceae bacterium]